MRNEPSMSNAPCAEIGGHATARSASNSIRVPPAATITSGPKFSSRTTPTDTSTPGRAMACTLTAGPSLSVIDR
jgi:hypothetical protein